MEITFGSLTLVFFILAVVFVIKTIKVVPQQHAWVVERLGKYHAILGPGLNIVIPFIDRMQILFKNGHAVFFKIQRLTNSGLVH